MIIPYKFGEHVRQTQKIDESEFSERHHEILSSISFIDGKLLIPDKCWSSSFLGAGEEKAVYCICDHNDRIFAIEIIDERYYLNGRFVGGKYFYNMRIKGLSGVKSRSDSVIGLTFTGLVKVREFVYGYEWSRFQFSPAKKNIIDICLTDWLKINLVKQFSHYQQHYKDVHERNVMFEIRSLSDKGIPIVTKDWNGAVKLCKVGIQPIDVR